MNNQRIYQYISGGCFALLAIWYLFHITGSWLNGVDAVAFALLALCIFLNMPLLGKIGCGIGVARNIYLLIIQISFVHDALRYGYSGIVIPRIFGCVLVIAAFVLLFVALQQPQMKKTFGLAAGGVLAVRVIIFLFAKYNFLFILLAILFTAGATFFAFSQPFPVKAAGETVANTGSVGKSAASSTGTIIEQLSRLKGLLDKGVITQEEFDEKKKQLLGL